jgi:hypothetical protein
MKIIYNILARPIKERTRGVNSKFIFGYWLNLVTGFRVSGYQKVPTGFGTE